MQKAAWWDAQTEDNIRCGLCPHACLLANGGTGRCRVRQHRDGALYSLNYGQVTSLASDPVEKKPLYHFFPGRQILSVGTWGCNFHCDFCQNWEIAHGTSGIRQLSPAALADLAAAQGAENIGVAFTYSEPTVWYEYVLDAAIAVRALGMKNVLVTNGFICLEPLEALLPHIDAMNIDVKAFNEGFYREVCGGSLKPVLRAVETAAKCCHVEVTTLIVPGRNDSEHEIDELSRWLAGVNPEIPLHLSRYFPRYKMKLSPTPPETLLRLRETARKYLRNVYIGNLPGA